MPTIALLDDEPQMLTALGRLLRTHDFEVAPFHEPAAFLASEGQDRFQCLVLDLNMPEIDGFEVLAARSENLPVIIITGKDQPGGRERALGLGASAYLQKPVSAFELLAALDACLDPAETSTPQDGLNKGSISRPPFTCSL